MPPCRFETLPSIVLGGDSSGGLLALQMLAALTDPGWTGGANGSISIVAAAFTYAPLVSQSVGHSVGQSISQLWWRSLLPRRAPLAACSARCSAGTAEPRVMYICPASPLNAHCTPAESLPACPQVEPAQHLSPTLVTSSFSQDESRGVVTGDPALYGVTLSQYWQGYAEVVRGALKGGGLSSITAEEALADFPLMNPLWASPEVLKQLPPLTIQVRSRRLLLPPWLWRALHAAVAMVQECACASLAHPTAICLAVSAPCKFAFVYASMNPPHRCPAASARPCLQVGGFDRYLAEAFEFAQRVAAAGARTVQLDVYDGMWNNFQMVHPGCGGGELEAAELCLSRTFAFVRAATGELTAAGGGLGPESLGYPRVQFHGRWPSTEQRDAVKQSMYTW